MKKKAFTMIEILVVITIIGVLFGAAVVSYSSITKTSRDAKRRADLEQIRAALEMWRSADTSANGQYPAFGPADCSNLTSDVVNFSEYLPQIPQDPKASTGYSYMCDSSSNTYTLYSVLEAATTDCGLECGSGKICAYAVGPYGKTCGP